MGDDTASKLDAWVRARPTREGRGLYGLLLYAAAGGSAWRAMPVAALEPLTELLETASLEEATLGELAREELDKRHRRALSEATTKHERELWARAQAASLQCAFKKLVLLPRHRSTQASRGQSTRLPAVLTSAVESVLPLKQEDEQGREREEGGPPGASTEHGGGGRGERRAHDASDREQGQQAGACGEPRRHPSLLVERAPEGDGAN